MTFAEELWRDNSHDRESPPSRVIEDVGRYGKLSSGNLRPVINNVVFNVPTPLSNLSSSGTTAIRFSNAWIKLLWTRM